MTAQDTFGRRVLAVVRRIPAGRVATYGDVAARAARGRSATSCVRRVYPGSPTTA
jgi:alkylated DNA nucleotide flippase Atl1